MVTLYLLWAAYGAAPLGLGGHAEPADVGGHGQADAHGGGHGAGGNGMQTAEFRKLMESFVEKHKLPDASVRPLAPDKQVGHDHAEHSASPTEVYLMAYQFGFTPAVLRLEAGVPYRFRMMAVDVAHGASVQLAPGARVVRLRPGALVEQEYTFKRAGEYLLYCTVYCGLAHDRMQGRIIVTEGEAKS
jgi:heme/copper-type cytochrome/quinol oxidase subunit 2